jgi:hypothetical protein
MAQDNPGTCNELSSCEKFAAPQAIPAQYTSYCVLQHFCIKTEALRKYQPLVNTTAGKMEFPV